MNTLTLTPRDSRQNGSMVSKIISVKNRIIPTTITLLQYQHIDLDNEHLHTVQDYPMYAIFD